VVLLLAGGAWWLLSSRDAAPAVADEMAQAVVPVSETDIALPSPTTLPATPPPGPTTPASGRVVTGPAASGAGQSPTSAAASGRSGATSASAAAERETAPTPSPAPGDAAPAVAIPNVKVLLVEGRRAVDRDATLNLGDGRIVAVSARDGATLVTWPYEAVTSATYVHARNPRWSAALAAPPTDLDVGGVFRASRHYLTLQNANEFAILRLEDINVIQIIRELESRTGLTIRRSPGEQE
jgi:hypothetical protein